MKLDYNSNTREFSVKLDREYSSYPGQRQTTYRNTKVPEQSYPDQWYVKMTSKRGPYHAIYRKAKDQADANKIKAELERNQKEILANKEPGMNAEDFEEFTFKVQKGIG